MFKILLGSEFSERNFTKYHFFFLLFIYPLALTTKHCFCSFNSFYFNYFSSSEHYSWKKVQNIVSNGFIELFRFGSVHSIFFTLFTHLIIFSEPKIEQSKGQCLHVTSQKNRFLLETFRVLG